MRRIRCVITSQRARMHVIGFAISQINLRVACDNHVCSSDSARRFLLGRIPGPQFFVGLCWYRTIFTFDALFLTFGFIVRSALNLLFSRTREYRYCAWHRRDVLCRCVQQLQRGCPLSYLLALDGVLLDPGTEDIMYDRDRRIGLDRPRCCVRAREAETAIEKRGATRTT